MTVTEIARLEQVSERQIQRYISLGFKGHKLPAARTRRAFVIDETDYRAWRVDCGFDFLPQPAPPQEAGGFPPGMETASTKCADCGTEVRSVPTFEEIKRRYFTPDRVGGPITNVPAVGSGSMCSPESAKQYHEALARRMLSQIRGYENEE